MPRKHTTCEFKDILFDKQPNLILLSDYKSSNEYVTVKCIIHNYIYNARARAIIGVKPQGCTKCAHEKLSNIKRIGADEFIRRSKLIHGDKYDYSKVVYKDIYAKVCILCEKHGEFWQSPNCHLTTKVGCKECSKEVMSLIKTSNTVDFIEKSNLVHFNFYNYSKVEYVNNSTEVCIICPNHGEFWQLPAVHIRPSGCPMCNRSRLEVLISNILIENNIPFEYQFRDKWLEKQSLDFYLPESNIAIECQGLQHFCKDTFFGGVDKFNLIVSRDILKSKKCSENNVKLLYVTDQTQFKKIIFEDSLYKGIYSEKNTICAGFKSDNPLKILFLDFLTNNNIKLN